MPQGGIAVIIFDLDLYDSIASGRCPLNIDLLLDVMHLPPCGRAVEHHIPLHLQVFSNFAHWPTSDVMVFIQLSVRPLCIPFACSGFIALGRITPAVWGG